VSALVCVLALEADWRAGCSATPACRRFETAKPRERRRGDRRIGLTALLCAIGPPGAAGMLRPRGARHPHRPHDSKTDAHLADAYPEQFYAAGDVAGPTSSPHGRLHQAGYAAVNALSATLRRSRWTTAVDFPAPPSAIPEVASVWAHGTGGGRCSQRWQVTRFSLAETPIGPSLKGGTAGKAPAAGFVEGAHPAWQRQDPGHDRG